MGSLDYLSAPCELLARLFQASFFRRITIPVMILGVTVIVVLIITIIAIATIKITIILVMKPAWSLNKVPYQTQSFEGSFAVG